MRANRTFVRIVCKITDGNVYRAVISWCLRMILRVTLSHIFILFFFCEAHVVDRCAWCLGHFLIILWVILSHIFILFFFCESHVVDRCAR